MKKTTLLLLLFSLAYQAGAQVLNEPANWPNTNWTVTGTYNADPNAFEADPTLTANFAFDDDDAGGASDDDIQAESPIIDLTAAFTAGETWLFVNANYVYNNLNSDTLGVEYWDADAATWNPWPPTLQADTAGAPLNDFCGAAAEPFVTNQLNIAGFTATQLSGFKYRIAYDDDDGWKWGFCFQSPILTSQMPPTCPDITGLTATTTGDSTADITWNAGGSETEWQITIQPAGTGIPTTDGTVTMQNAPYPATGLTASTAYEVYVRGNCGVNGFSNWIGPINFTTFNTPPPVPVGVICASGTSSIVFTETFGTDDDLDPSGWTGTGFDGSNGNWDITNPNGNSGGTGPANSYDGNPGVHLEYEATGNSSDIASAISPAIDLTLAVDGAELAFFMHAFGDDIGTLNVNIGTNPAGPFTTEYTWVGDYQSTAAEAWVPIGINLDAYLGQIIYIEFSYGATGNSFEGDMSIDQITVETCGNFCIAPSNIMAANITHTNADISWTANNGETQWEYVIQPAGTGTPTGAGTVTNTLGFMATGLSPLTDYEVYVLADCGSSQSVWAGPFNFSTTMQLNFVVDCAVGPQNITYCYENNDANVFTFTSTDSSPLNFTINAGNVENNWDELLVFDSDGTTDLNAATPYGNNGNVAGISYQSTGDTISFTVQADGVFSCSSEGYTPLNITVSCATCINPTATYQVIDDCANGDQFLVDVNITSLGDATSLSIEDNQGNPAVSVSATGITQFGPYLFDIDIIFTISNEQDVNCVITSPAFQLNACPPANDDCSGATVAVVNDSFLCEVSTPGTLLEATPSGVANASCGGDPDDDVWFQFVATSEFQLIALANLQGSNTFNIDHALYENNCGALVEIACEDADLSSVTPALIIGNTYFVRIFSGGGNPETTTFDLCITPYIAPTNITCDATENLCPGAGDLYTYNTVNVRPGLGSIDCLGSSPDPTFSIFEIGSSGDINIEMVQNTAFDGLGNPIGDELDVDFALWGPFDPTDDFCNGGDYPSSAPIGCSFSAAPIENFVINAAVAGDIYVVLITNFAGDPGIIQINQTNLDPNNPDPNAGTLSAEIEVEIVSSDTAFIDDDNDVTTPPVANLCGFNSITIEADSPFADVYEWYVNGILDPTLTTASITVTESNFYSVTAYDTQCMGNDTKTVIVNLYQDAMVSVVPPDEVSITTCDDESGDGIEDFNLHGLSSIILDAPGQDPADFLLTYHATLNEAQTGTNALSSPYSATDGTIIYVRVEDVDSVGSGSGCASTNTTFTLTVLGALPEVSGIDDLELCDGNNDGIESFNLELNTSDILNGQDPTVFDVSYHVSQLDADSGMNALVSPYDNISNPQTIYFRIENTSASDCYKTSTFDIFLSAKPILIQSGNVLSCDSDTDGITSYDLTVNESVIVNNQTGFTFSYYTSLTDAETSIGAIATPMAYTSAVTTIYVRVEDADGCFEVTTFDLQLAPKPVLVQADSILGCDNDEDGITNYDLTTNESVIVNNQTGFTFTYHTNVVDAENSMNSIIDPSNFDGGTQTIVVRVEDADGCFETTTFDLIFGTLPESSFDSNIVYEVCPNATVPITVEAMGDNYTESEVTITWYNEGVLVPGQTDLIIDNVLTSGTYTIEVMFNDTGCIASEDIFVEEFEICVIPQGISPNGDGLNDTFDLSSYDVQSLTIFNRNGVKIYEKTNYLDEWHGQSLDGDELPVGTYYYIMNYQGTKTKAAWVYINRENN